MKQTKNLVVHVSMQAEVVLKTDVKVIHFKWMRASRTFSTHNWAEENIIVEF